MKLPIPPLLLLSGLLIQFQPAPAQRIEQSVNYQAIGTKRISVDRTLQFDQRGFHNQLLGAIELDLANVQSNSSVDLMIGGIRVNQINLPRGTRGRKVIQAPFKVLWESGLPVELAFNGRFTLRSLAVNFGPVQGVQHPNRPVVPGVIPGMGQQPPPTRPPVTQPGQQTQPVIPCERVTKTFDAKRWATRTREAWLEQPRACGQIGGNVVDGWDFPERGCRRDGISAIRRKGHESALSLFFDDITASDFDRLRQVKLELYGRGPVEVALATQAFREHGSQKLELQFGRKATLSLGDLQWPKANLQQFEIVIRGEGEFRVDGVSVIAELETCRLKDQPGQPPQKRSPPNVFRFPR